MMKTINTFARHPMAIFLEILFLCSLQSPPVKSQQPSVMLSDDRILEQIQWPKSSRASKGGCEMKGAQ